MKETLIDTDILSFYFKGDKKVENRIKSYLQEFGEFVSNNTIIHLSEQSVEISSKIYADLRQKGITVGSSDILIAGIAVENELTLVTNNEKHYESIFGLEIVNWKK